MLYSRKTSGPIGDVVGRLEEAVKDHRFGVLGTIDLKGKVTVATVKPTVLIHMYEHGEDLRPIAEEVEGTLLRIIDSACAKR